MVITRALDKKGTRAHRESKLLDLEALQHVADDEEELEDPAPLPLGPTVEEQDPAALPKGPELFELHILQPRRCHLFRVLFILRILSILQQPFLHHPALLLRLRL